MTPRIGLVVLSAVVLAGSARADERVTVSMRDGLVTLRANQASLRDILTEWAKVGQVQIVNLDKLSGGPITLQLVDVPEKRALETLLRTAAGFMAAPRAVQVADASRFDRLIIMPTSVAIAASAPLAGNPAVRPAAAMAMPALPEPDPEPEPDLVDEPVDPNPPANVIYADRPPETQFDYANPESMQQLRQMQMQSSAPGMQQASPAPMFFPSSFNPNPQGGQQAAPAQPTNAPSAGQTTARPGEIVQPPTPAQQFQNPYGIPGDVAPGSVAPPPNIEPDRSKYMNPYQPTPPRPPQE